MHSLTLSFETFPALQAFVARVDFASVVAVQKAETPAAGSTAATATGKPKAEKPAAAPAPAAASAAEPPASAPAASAPPADAGVPYPVLQKAVFALAGKGDEGKAACAALCAEFKVKTFKELDPSKFAEALAAVQKKTAELAAVPA